MAHLDMELWLAVGFVIPMFLLVWMYLYSKSQQGVEVGGAKVPPGKFWQLPFVGESIQFVNGSADDFMLPHISKYGKIFRTHLLGTPSICTTTVDAAKFVLQSPSLFKASYSTSMTQLLGQGSINRVEGELHARYRKIVQAPIISGSLKGLVRKVDHLALRFAHENGDQAIIQAHTQFLRFTLHVAMLFCCEDLELGAETDEFVNLFQTMESGFVALPVNLPGTTFYKALKARDKVLNFLHQQIKKRRLQRSSGTVEHRDLLDAFLSCKDADGGVLPDERIAESIMFVLVAGHETTASVLVWAIRYLALYPDILQVVKAENDAVARQREQMEDPITWEEVKKLTFTSKLLQETLRITNVVALTWREATEDVVYNGMVFPKGWRVFAWHRYFHLDSEVHANPLEFNPWRFETQPKANTFTPFGNGNRVCPGRELAMNEMLIFLHRFLTTYDFEAIGDLHTLTYWAIPLPKDRLPLKLTKRTWSAAT